MHLPTLYSSNIVDSWSDFDIGIGVVVIVGIAVIVIIIVAILKWRCQRRMQGVVGAANDTHYATSPLPVNYQAICKYIK